MSKAPAQFKSDFAILDVKAGRHELAKRIRQGAKIRVQVEMVIDTLHGHDDGTSIPFSGEVLSVREVSPKSEAA